MVIYYKTNYILLSTIDKIEVTAQFPEVINDWKIPPRENFAMWG